MERNAGSASQSVLYHLIEVYVAERRPFIYVVLSYHEPKPCSKMHRCSLAYDFFEKCENKFLELQGKGVSSFF